MDRFYYQLFSLGQNAKFRRQLDAYFQMPTSEAFETLKKGLSGLGIIAEADNYGVILSMRDDRRANKAKVKCRSHAMHSQEQADLDAQGIWSATTNATRFKAEFFTGGKNELAGPSEEPEDRATD